jgi:hypothetical protein
MSTAVLVRCTSRGRLKMAENPATTGQFLAIDPYHIPRIMVGPGDDLPTFAAKVGDW